MSNSLLLLDTQMLLWLDRDDSQLGAGARAAISAAWRDDRVAVSAISFWEAAMLQARQRIALAAVELAAFHPDPADRFIAATAQTLQAQLMTADAAILNWSGSVPRLDARR